MSRDHHWRWRSFEGGSTEGGSSEGGSSEGGSRAERDRLRPEERLPPEDQRSAKIHELGAFVEHRPPWLGPSHDARIMQPPPVARVIRPRTTRPDARIREDVCEALTHDGWLDATHVEVTVEAGHVVLDGEVPDRNQKWRAEDHAEHALGVLAVVNRIRVVKAAGDELERNDRAAGREASREDDRRPIGGPTPRW